MKRPQPTLGDRRQTEQTAELRYLRGGVLGDAERPTEPTAYTGARVTWRVTVSGEPQLKPP
jgi:hypothetical protein